MGRYGITRPAGGILRAAEWALFLSLICWDASAADGTFDESRKQEEIVVTATRLDTPVERMTASVTVITGEDLARGQRAFVEEALRAVPGVAVGQTGGQGRLTEIRMRGTESNQTLVLIDGIEVNDPIRGSVFNLDHLTAVGIDRIEVLRGPAGALYGSDAMGGVINIVTRKGRGAPTATVKAEAGGRGATNAAASVSGGNDQGHFALSAGRYKTAGISAASAARGNRELDGYRNETLRLKTGVTLGGALDVDLIGHFTRADVDTDDFQGGVGAVDNASRTLTFQRFGRAEARLKLFDGSWEQKLGLSAADQKADNFDDGNRLSSLSRGIKNKVDYQSAFRFGTSVLADAGHEILVGVEHEEERGRFKSAFTSVDRRVITEGAFAHYGLGLWDRLFLTAGGRKDESDFFPDAATWRMGAAYLHRETGSKLKGGYGTAFKAPTLFELFGFAQNFQGNPTLKPEESTGWDLGVEQALWDGRARVEAVYFRNRIRNLIIGAGQTALNVPGARADGVEVAASARPLPDVDVTFSYTFTRTRDSQSGDDLVRRPKHMANFGLHRRLMDGRAEIGLEIGYFGRQDDFFFDAAFNRVQVEMPSRTLVNLSGTYELAPGVKASARVTNLFDRRYEEVLSFGAPGVAAYAGLQATF